MDCTKSQELMSLALDNQLNEIEEKTFQEHLRQCSDCREEYVLYQSITQDLNATSEADLPDGFHNDLMQRINEDKVLPFRKRFNYKQFNIAAVLVMVVVFALVGINNLSDMNQGKMEEAAVMDTATESTSSKEMAMEVASEPIMEESAAEPAMMKMEAEDEAEPAPIAEVEEAKSDSADMSNDEASSVAETTQESETTTSSDEAGSEVANKDSQGTTESTDDSDLLEEENAILARNGDEETFTPKSSENGFEDKSLITTFSETVEEEAPQSIWWLWLVFGSIAVITASVSMMILKMKK